MTALGISKAIVVNSNSNHVNSLDMWRKYQRQQTIKRYKQRSAKQIYNQGKKKEIEIVYQQTY